MKRNLVGVALLAVVFLCGFAYSQEVPVPEQDVVARVLGNGDAALVGVGLQQGIAEWGIEIMHQPADELTFFGLWATLNTPEVNLLAEDVLPPFWKGLDVQGYAVLNVLTDQDFNRVLTMPGIGARLAPLETVCLTGEIVYPMGKDTVPTQLDLNSLNYFLGLEIRF